jgi:hypothetical protein
MRSSRGCGPRFRARAERGYPHGHRTRHRRQPAPRRRRPRWRQRASWTRPDCAPSVRHPHRGDDATPDPPIRENKLATFPGDLRDLPPLVSAPRVRRLQRRRVSTRCHSSSPGDQSTDGRRRRAVRSRTGRPTDDRRGSVPAFRLQLPSSVSDSVSRFVSQTDWIVLAVGVVLLVALGMLSRQIDDLRARLAPDDDDDDDG